VDSLAKYGWNLRISNDMGSRDAMIGPKAIVMIASKKLPH
jgi:hypothetical protein